MVVGSGYGSSNDGDVETVEGIVTIDHGVVSVLFELVCMRGGCRPCCWSAPCGDSHRSIAGLDDSLMVSDSVYGELLGQRVDGDE